MGKACCGTNHSAMCDCLPSTFLVNIPSYTHSGGYTLIAQSVLAYKCCYTYQASKHIVFRINPINVGTAVNNNCNTPVFFNLSLFYNILEGYTCQIGTTSFISYSAMVNATLPACNIYYTARSITAPTACGGISTDNLCGETNNLMQSGQAGVNLWGSSLSCNAYIFQNIIVERQNQYFIDVLNNPCEIPTGNYVITFTPNLTLTFT